MDNVLVEAVGMDALNGGAIAAYQGMLRAARPGNALGALSQDELLARLGAAGVSADGLSHPTRAGLLMFGDEYQIVKEFPDYFLDYRDESSGGGWGERVVSNDGEWSGCVFDFWRTVLPRLLAAVGAVGTAGAAGAAGAPSAPRHFAADALPETLLHKAVREAFANALVHADYRGKRYVVVVRGADRITFSNPGRMLAGGGDMRGGVSDARNPTLVKMFSLVNACERAGRGLAVIRQAGERAALLAPRLLESADPERTELTIYLGAAPAPVPGGELFARSLG